MAYEYINLCFIISLLWTWQRDISNHWSNHQSNKVVGNLLEFDGHFFRQNVNLNFCVAKFTLATQLFARTFFRLNLLFSIYWICTYKFPFQYREYAYYILWKWLLQVMGKYRMVKLGNIPRLYYNGSLQFSQQTGIFPVSTLQYNLFQREYSH